VRERQTRGDVLLVGGEHGLVRRARQQAEHALRRRLVVRLERADDLRPRPLASASTAAASSASAAHIYHLKLGGL